MPRRASNVAWRHALRLAALRREAVMVLYDEPHENVRRACRHCGAPVASYVLPCGEELRCEAGHRLGEHGWNVVPN